MNVDGKDFLGPEGPWVKGSGIAIHQVNNSHLWIRDSHVDLCHMLEIVEENCPVSTPWKADQAPAKLKRRASVSALCGPQPIASPRRYKTDTCWGEKNPPAGKQQWNPAHQRGEKHQGILETKPHKINLKKSLRDNSLRDFWIHSKKFGPVGYIRLMQTAFPLKAATPDSFMVRASEKRERECVGFVRAHLTTKPGFLRKWSSHRSWGQGSPAEWQREANTCTHSQSSQRMSCPSAQSRWGWGAGTQPQAHLTCSVVSSLIAKWDKWITLGNSVKSQLSYRRHVFISDSIRVGRGSAGDTTL